MSPASSDVDPLREVRRVHMMLEDWYLGIRDDLNPFEKALDRDFTWVGPDGSVGDGRAMIGALSSERTNVKGAEGPVRFEVDQIDHRRDRYGLHLLTYVKRLQAGQKLDARQCTVWLAETDRAPTGLQWLHLQETPIVAGTDEED